VRKLDPCAAPLKPAPSKIVIRRIRSMRTITWISVGPALQRLAIVADPMMCAFAGEFLPAAKAMSLDQLAI
jgi:hypothetical protein